MSRFLKSRDYLMKCLGFVLLLGFISLGAIGGCNNDGDELSQITQALTENDFANDPSLRADPEKHLIVKFLEHPDSEKSENDTGEVGVDTIPFRYTRTLEHTFCWEDDDGEAGHFMELDDSDGNEIFRLDVNGECITVVLEAGDYLMHIHHDGRIEETIPIFIVPGRNGEQEAQKIDTNEGLLKSAKNIYAKIINNLHNIITQKVKAQTVAQNVSTLLSSKVCIECNLTGANLEGAILTGADLSGADLTAANLHGAILTRADLVDANLTNANLTRAKLTMAILSEAILIGANLTQANLLGANLQRANLDGAILSEAILTGADLNDANLTNANLTAANLTGADLFFADLSFANLTGADLTGADLRGVTLDSTIFTLALWCDGGCTCAVPSIDTCVGCASIDTCDGSP